ncbi:MAG TPA: aminotransferase class V-fold PLP-dependent enzyme [Terriglobales bacterium]|jgi:selenocysteine lyase/cysteine desulfurase
MPSPALRDQFPVTSRYAYLNHAAVAPLARVTRQAINQHLDEQTSGGALHWTDWLTHYERVRAVFARLINALPDDIALTKNTTEGLCFIAQGLAWTPGDRIISFESEFPANLFPWLALRSRGVLVELLPESALGDLDRLRAACRGARLLAVSSVQYLSGYRAPLAELGQICREAGTLLVVDGIQSLGAFPLDAPASGIHALACGGHKWLTGPAGAGFLYVEPGLLQQLIPAEPGWFSVDSWEDFDVGRRAAARSGPLTWRPGAARLECGMLNGAGLVGLGAAVDLLMQTGIPAIAGHILALNQRLTAGLRTRGYEILADSRPATALSGITAFRRPGMDPGALLQRLQAAGVLVSHRGDCIRVSPHGYNTADEIDRLLAALP